MNNFNNGDGQLTDVIIPAHQALKLCPEGNYDNAILPFKSRINLKLIRRSQNGGAGAARQTGIDATINPYFTCIDADDNFLGEDFLATLRHDIEISESVKCCGGTFISQGRDNVEICVKKLASMDGKLCRCDFTRSYGIRFNGTRSNENMGYNMLVYLPCDSPAEQILLLDDNQFSADAGDKIIESIAKLQQIKLSDKFVKRNCHAKKTAHRTDESLFFIAYQSQDFPSI